MPNQKCLVVRLTKGQHERIKNNAEIKGYSTISSYIRSIALVNSLNFEMKINEVHNRIINGNNQKTKKNDHVKLTRFF